MFYTFEETWWHRRPELFQKKIKLFFNEELTQFNGIMKLSAKGFS